MTRFALFYLGGGLLLAGCNQSAQNPGPNSNLPPNFMETAQAEALKVFRSSWTNGDGVWTSYFTPSRRLIQLTNLDVRVEVIELTEQQVQSGVRAGAEVFVDAELARNNSLKGKWTEWKPTTAQRYRVLESNGVWHVENNYRKSFVLPPAKESKE